jgi:O-antigen/teichoic acid export membrane protein
VRRLILDAGLLRASAIVLAGDSLARFLGFLFAVAAARLLTPAGYGQIAYALAVSAIVSVLTLNAPYGLSRFLARQQGNARTIAIYSTNWLTVIAAMMAVSLTLLVPVALISGLGGAMLFALAANLLGTAVLQTYRESQKAVSRFWATSTFWALANLLELIVILLVSAIGWRSPALFLTIYGLSSVWALVIMQPLAPAGLAFKRALVNRRQVMAIWRFSAPLILQGVFYTIWVGADVILLQHFRHAGLGSYATAKTLALILIVPPMAISTALAPRMARLETHQVRGYLLYVVGLTAAVTVPIGAVMAVFGMPIISAVFGSRYAIAGTILPVLALAQVLYGLYLVLAGSWAWGLGRPQIDPIATGAAMIATLASGLLLVPVAGLMGAALAYAAGAATQFLVIAGFTVWTIYTGATPRLAPGRELVLESV